MHSSGMRTARLLTACRGVSVQGVSAREMSATPPPRPEADTPPVDRQTPLKT